MKRIDLDTTDSRHSGLAGVFEKILRRFKTAMHIALMIPIYLAAAISLGLCLVPAISLFRWMTTATIDWPGWAQNISYGITFAIGFFLYGFSLILLAPTINFFLRGYLKAWRGPYYSVESLKWFLHNGLTYLVRFTFLEFVTPSPISLMFYRLMGMKIGRGVLINTTWISDPSLIEIGNKVTLGGSVTIVAHYGQGGLLVVAPVVIGNNCTIGLKATLMGGSRIGDGAKVMPHSVVMPNTVIPPGELWGGVPAARIDRSKKLEAA